MTDVKLSEFKYDFPQKLIAKYPTKIRGQSRLLVLNRQTGIIGHRSYGDLIDYVKSGDVVVLNDTKVIKARLIARNKLGAKRELLLIEKHGKSEDWHRHKVVFRGRLETGEVLKVGDIELRVESVESNGTALISSKRDLMKLAEEYGFVPLPPYMKRSATKDDVKRYQTVFAHEQGSVAAPTASLNFTQEMQQRLKAKGVEVVYLTLHVGLGTFLPIRTNDLEQHKMHSEYFYVPAKTVSAIKQAKEQGHKITAVGTTVTRTLEYMSEKILNQESDDLSGEVDIFIYPGYKFEVVDQLLTNFHAPKSTVLMLAAAFADWDKLKTAYDEAAKQNYALLSYGDSMLII